MKPFRIKEELIFYDPDLRLSVKEGGTWPHPNHYGFCEAVVAAHFIMRGYQVLTDYSASSRRPEREVKHHFSCLFRHVVGEKAAKYIGELGGDYRGSGQPDVFVFCEGRSQDPKCDPLTKWFFAEAKGKDKVSDSQKKFWRAIAEREDIGLGPQRIKLFRAVSRVESDPAPAQTFEY
jgi:hypothetical protein